MTEAAWPPWPERVAAGGPEWHREGLLLVPLGVIAVLTAQAGTISTWGEFLGWCLAGMAGIAASLLSLLAASVPFRRTFHRAASQRTRALVVIATAVASGVAFGFAVWACARFLSLADTEPLWWRILGSAVIVAWFEIVVALSLDAHKRLRRERDALIDEAIALESARLTTTAIIDEIQAEVAAQVESGLVAARGGLPRADTEAEAADMWARWPDVAAALRATAAQTVRPLSRTLWESAPDTSRRPRPWSLLTYVVTRQPLRPLAVSTLYVLGSGSLILRQQPLGTAVAELTSGVLAIFAVMLLANALMRRAPHLHAVVFLSAAVVLQVPVVANYAWASDSSKTTESLAGTVATVLAGLVVILATSAFGAITTMTQQRLGVLASAIDEEFIASTARSATVARLLREAAAIVHGSVQSRLLGCAIAVEEAGRNADPEQFSAALARALEALENPVASLGRTTPSSLSEEVRRRQDLWDGLCAVTYTVAADVPDQSPEMISACGRIIEEGIANAVRHGEAQHVDIVIDVAPEPIPLLRLTISDDGIGPSSPEPTPGLGMQLIGSLAESSSLQRRDNRTVLTVHLCPS